MSSSPALLSLLGNSSSVVVVAPHPDDESLAAGGLIRIALEAGVRVSVVVLTDGDANPWPQRAAEKRVMIGVADRRRWGARRRGEVRSALSVLGVAADSVHHAGMPDLGITASLLRDVGATVDSLTSAFHEAAPSLVVAPSLHDRHPDHSAAHVMCRLALARSGAGTTMACYTVHGATPDSAQGLPLPHEIRARKLLAVAAHSSQLMLSRKRMLAYAERPERFELITDPARGPGAHPIVLPWRSGVVRSRLLEMLVVTGNGAWKMNTVAKHDRDSCAPSTHVAGNGRMVLHLPHPHACDGPIFVKLASRIPSPFIYDRWGWAAFPG